MTRNDDQIHDRSGTQNQYQNQNGDGVETGDGVRILVVDNYDSFAYNLVQYLGSYAEEVITRRNDAITVDGVREVDPDGIVVSPGPGTPQEAGVSMSLFAGLSYPTLGVCLGHQALCAVHGAEVGHAPDVVHGKSSIVYHDGEGIFEGIPDEFAAGRYHSLAVHRADLPAVLEESAYTDTESELVMGVRHRDEPHFGVQFHPESILTEHGTGIVRNFVERCNTSTT
jgi:anthranilate synthase component 2